MKNKGIKQGKDHVIIAISIGIGSAILLTILLTVGLTSLILSGRLAEQGSGLMVFVVRFLAILLGALIGTGICKEKVLPVTGGVCLGYLLVLVAIGIIVYDGSFQGFGAGILSSAVGAFVVVLMRLKGSMKPKYKLRTKI